MSEKIADALWEEAKLWSDASECGDTKTLAMERGAVCMMIANSFSDLAARIDSRTNEPSFDPGGEESTPDKPF